ncbi:CPBP family intramembrane metalloprotease [Massilia sp. H-1]|nr:CPBP family intramembrane metalloprotease [Massilia sp. H-1]
MPELLFAAYLVLVFPLQQLWRSLKPNQPDRAAEPKLPRYFRTIRGIAVMLAVMVLLLWHSGRTAADVGLDMPVSVYGEWGLVLCAAIMLTSFVFSVAPQPSRARTAPNLQAKIEAVDSIPRAARACLASLLMSLFIGVGWELLYRGFLMLVLPGVLGTVGAILATSIAYGVSHGYKNRGQFVGSIISAFLFTMGYVLSHSLWWLIVLHLLAPVYMGIMGYRVLKAAYKLTPSVAAVD